MESHDRETAGPAVRYHLRAGFLASATFVGLFTAQSGQAQQLGDAFILAATGSCPTFHCDAEGTSLMQHALPMPASGTSLSANGELDPAADDMPGDIGCSSDDSNVVCLFDSGADAAISYAVGAQGQTQLVQNFVLARDGNDWKPWSSQLASLEGQGSNHAPVPMIGADHSVIIADGNWVKRYTQSGIQVWPSSVSPLGSGDVGLQLGYEDRRTHSRNLVGLTPIQWGGETAIAVTFDDGDNSFSRDLANVVVYRATDGTFIAKYPATTTDSSTQGIQITDEAGITHTFDSVSPPVSHGGSLYFAGYEASTDLGVLARLDLSGDPGNRASSQLTLTTYITFGGKTGASALFEDNNRFTNFPYNQVLLNVPDVSRGSIAQLGCDVAAGGVPVAGSHIVSLSPDLATCNWASALNTSGNSGLSGTLIVGPAIDPVNAGFWVWTSAGSQQSTGGSTLFHYLADGGVYDRTINLLAACQAAAANCGALPGIVGHLQTINPPGSNSLYLTTFIGANLGTAMPMNAIAFDGSSNVGIGQVITWLAPISDLDGNDTGGALPMVTFSNGAPGVMMASSARGQGVGEVSLISSCGTQASQHRRNSRALQRPK